MFVTNQMVRALAGAPLTVLILLQVNRTSLTQSYIRRNTGFSDHVVHDALELLHDYGYVTQTGRYTWQLADGVFQLPLMQALPEPEADPAPEIVEEKEECVDIEENPEDENLARILCDLNPLASSSSLTTRNLESDLTTTRAPSSQILRANLEELDNFGIREPARSRVAKKTHVTPELIRYHCGSSKSTGQAIYRIEHNWAIPDGWQEPAPDGWQEPAPDNLPDIAEDAAHRDGEELARQLFQYLEQCVSPIMYAEIGYTDAWINGSVLTVQAKPGTHVALESSAVGNDQLNILINRISNQAVTKIIFREG
jgi:hypothetical protein